MHACVSSKCQPLKVCPVASLRLIFACATSPRLDLLPFLPFPAFTAQILDVTCIRGPAEAPQVYPLQSQRGGRAGTNYGSLGIAFTVEKQQVTVKSIKSNSPAAFDGSLKVGDVVVRIDNRPVATTEAGLKEQELGEPGKPVTLTIERKGFLGIEQRIVVIRRPRGQDGGPQSLKGAERGSKDDNQGFMESAAYAAGFQVGLQFAGQSLGRGLGLHDIAGRRRKDACISLLTLRAVFAASSSPSSTNTTSTLCCSNTTPTPITARPVTWADLYVPRLQRLRHRRGEFVRKLMPWASLCQRIPFAWAARDSGWGTSGGSRVGRPFGAR